MGMTKGDGMRRLPRVIARILWAGMLLCAVLQTSPGAAQSRSPIDPPLVDMLNALPADQTVSVIVILKNQTDVRVIKGHDGLEKRRNLVTALHDKSDTTQTSIRSLLQFRNRQSHRVVRVIFSSRSTNARIWYIVWTTTGQSSDQS